MDCQRGFFNGGALTRNAPDISVGNIVVSNIVDVLKFFKSTVLIKPVPVAVRLFTFDLPIMIATTVAITVFRLTH
jgi:Ca2+/Na+ antiporter